MKYWESDEDKIVVGEEIEGGGWYIEIPDPFITGDTYELFEVPQFGGEPHSIASFYSFADALQEANHLT